MRINRYLNKGYRSTAAMILVQAFKNKLLGILGTEEQLYKVILQSIDAKHIVVARSSEGELIGVAAYQYNGKFTLDITLSTMIEVYGFWRGIQKMFMLFTHFPTKRDISTLYVDALAVDARFRGQGVGQLLLKEIEKITIEENLSFVSLDVVKENTRAKELYEKVGFVEVKYEELDTKSSDRLGFSGYYYMMKLV
ncbi:GNAT family N-acetyltransferase [Myroides sp. M-43]|uniref:GNAT family N-acetyltransferase n=1 Tax=Myroides oncorhynchi TaxID=2893756 RepID=UPI001E43469A|nr:GNAT family N-acetyltransferase [Myroides oncorhynchi]MCC9043737.1 GNAT family N-acetyltransferase [Myroides oncorhynchi]